MNILRPIDQGQSYIYCPTCRTNGNPKSMLSRDMHRVSCMFGHQWDLSGFRQLLAQQPDMAKMEELLVEQPDPRCVRWTVYVLPETKEALEHKLVGRLHATTGVLMAALASDEVIFLTGEPAAKLKKKGLNTGEQIVAALDGVAQMEADRDAAIKRLETLTAMLRNAGVTE